jgi:hypothetical protein
VSTTVYVLNRCPMKSMDSMTPFEAWHRKKPLVQHLKTLVFSTSFLSSLIRTREDFLVGHPS